MCRVIIKGRVMQVYQSLSIYLFFSQSIGGCIVTANPTSDLNPVFMAARCTLLLATAGGIQSLFITATTRSPWKRDGLKWKRKMKILDQTVVLKLQNRRNIRII